MTNPLHEEFVRRYPPAPAFAPDDMSFPARVVRLKKQVQGTEPFEFDPVMECVYDPGGGEMFIDHCYVEHAGKLWNFHIVGKPDDLEKADPRIRKLKYEYDGYAIGNTLFDLEYQGRVMDEPSGEWDCIVSCLCLSIVPFRDGFAGVYNAVGLEQTRLGVAFTKDLIHWERSSKNPILAPPPWAEPFGTCKDCHVMPLDDQYLIYYRVTSKDGYGAIAVASTTDFERFEHHDPVYKFPDAMRGTGGIESVCVFPRDGIYHLFFCAGQGTWHTISDNPYQFKGTNGLYLMGPFVAAEIFSWDNRWWLSSTKKEELRRVDRLKGISNHATREDERRNLAGMFLAEIHWEGDFPRLAKPDHPAMTTHTT